MMSVSLPSTLPHVTETVNNAKVDMRLKSVKDMAKIDKAAQEFEAVFITEMMKPMFETVGVDEMFGGGKGEEVFRSFLTQEYGKKLAETGGIGLAPFVRDQLIKLQEAREAPPQNAPSSVSSLNKAGS
jgi:peptidoglycan hydrolase FlgJ